MATTWKKLAYEADVVFLSDFRAYTLLVAVTDDYPVQIAIAEQTLVGRLTGGDIKALTAAEAVTLLGVTFVSNFLVNQVFS